MVTTFHMVTLSYKCVRYRDLRDGELFEENECVDLNSDRFPVN